MTRIGVAALLPAVLGPVAACGDDVVQVRVRVAVDAASCGPGAETTLSLPCQGRVGVWLVDDAGVVLDQACVPASGYRPVSALDDLLRASGISFAGLAVGERVTLELAVLPGSSSGPCVRPGAVPDGSAFLAGQSLPTELGPDTEIRVALECRATEDQCQPALDVTATVIDLASATAFPDPIPVPSLELGEVLKQRYEPLLALSADADGVGWEGVVPERPVADCLAASLTGLTDLMPLMSCDAAIDTAARTAIVEAHLLPEQIRDVISSQFIDELGASGLVFGKVVGPEGPREGVKISLPADTTEASIVYFLDDATPGGDATSANGYFLIRGGGCCQTIHATSDSDPDGVVTTGATGAVAGFVTTTLIRLP